MKDDGPTTFNLKHLVLIWGSKRQAIIWTLNVCFFWANICNFRGEKHGCVFPSVFQSQGSTTLKSWWSVGSWRRTQNWRMKTGSGSCLTSKTATCSGRKRSRRWVWKFKSFFILFPSLRGSTINTVWIKGSVLWTKLLAEAKKKSKDVFPPQPTPRKEAWFFCSCW